MFAGQYIPLDHIHTADLIYSSSLAICVFASILHLLHPLSFSVTISSLKRLLLRLRSSAADFAIIVSVILVCFSHTLTIAFCSQTEFTRSMSYSLYTLAGMSMLGFSRKTSAELESRFAGGILILTFSIVMQIIMMNFLISFIVITVQEVKKDLAKRQADRELSEHLWRRISKWLHLERTEKTTSHCPKATQPI